MMCRTEHGFNRSAALEQNATARRPKVNCSGTNGTHTVPGRFSRGSLIGCSARSPHRKSPTSGRTPSMRNFLRICVCS